LPDGGQAAFALSGSGGAARSGVRVTPTEYSGRQAEAQGEEDAVTDGLDDDFGDGFFSSLAASPDDPASAYDSGTAFDEGAGEDDYHFLYEVEGDGSFETDAEDFGDDAFDHDAFDHDYYDDYEYDHGDVAGTDDGIEAEPAFDPDHDFVNEGDDEFRLDFGQGFGPA
jgi:hypothetical protein